MTEIIFDESEDWEKRVLCSDESCIGTIGHGMASARNAGRFTKVFFRRAMGSGLLHRRLWKNPL